MGSCISKCRTKKKFKEDCSCSHVQDKLVISQDHPKSSTPSNPTPPAKSKAVITPSHESSPFSCSDNSKSSATMATSSSSCNSSSALTAARDRSFSNEFLWSCVKENPQITGVKQSLENPKRTPLQNLQHSTEFSPLVTRRKHSVRENLTSSTPKKRSRANSPTLVRQKSFRKEHNIGLRSPSPSRRFIGENNRIFLTDENSCRGPIFSNANATSTSLSYGVKKESFRPPTASPNRDFSIKRNVKVDVCSSKKTGADHCVAEDIQSRQGLDILMEDINNPLIALDCFIFL
ncbi:hypothetical protein F511_22035 [Dorcoceras hygrometricum]|uniref:Uncharacterized protein n=1 Tax=Dorcoceras hygrometricum TaxID=472368 RepID=A0A2Z7AEB3_9LAMI|nr:hypothetical protein F511_22035 [Dorcoceras hygrometricum]